MKIEFYKPSNNTLRKYIEGYYFIAEDKNSKPIQYFTFPNNYCILSVSQNVKLQLEEKHFFISSSENKNTIANFVSRYAEPIEIVYENTVNEITIYFKPLGINHFLEAPEIFKKNKIEDFNPFPDFKDEMENIFILKNRDNQIEKLENYWLSKFSEKDLTLAGRLLCDIEADLKIEEIAEKHNFTRQYINKLFSKSVGKTPSEYRKIHRFRNSLFKHQKSKNLTELSHGNLFYDQSHFNKDFKTFTNKNPSAFFKNVDTEKGNIWFFI
ncbi:helix-turn-helix domain-containing protein [Gelidibacter gilvus]|nr:helix-turn-helix domain-containing protein [Gelidibacter gilvus]